MEGIRITLAEVSKTAGDVRRYNGQMDQQLQEIRKIMNQLTTTWQSPASEAIRAKLNGMVPIFENYRDIVESYAKFLDLTVTSYETTEQSIQQGASSFQ